MKVRLGYACISNVINITSSKTITLTNYNKLDMNMREVKLDKIIVENLNNLESLIKYNIKNNIHFFRITSKLIPLMDMVFINLDKYRCDFLRIGNLINESNMRVDVHADQYCVLNSVNDQVVLNSIIILNSLNKVMDMFNVRYNIILHIGSKTNGVEEGIKRFKNNFGLLDEDLRKKIILENDDKNYNVLETLRLCEEIGVPMCLDIHHHYCNRCSGEIEDYLSRIYKTFKQDIPKMHFSSPKNKREFRAHSEFIDSIEFIKFVDLIRNYNIDTDIMLEAKGKDLALIKLVYELKFKENYCFIDETSFTI